MVRKDNESVLEVNFASEVPETVGTIFQQSKGSFNITDNLQASEYWQKGEHRLGQMYKTCLERKILSQIIKRQECQVSQKCPGEYTFLNWNVSLKNKQKILTTLGRRAEKTMECEEFRLSSGVTAIVHTIFFLFFSFELKKV